MGTNANYQGRIEDDRLTTGRGRFVADITMPGLAHAVIVRSQLAHGRLAAIEIEDALAMPGVIAVLTAADLAADGIGDQPCPVTHRRPDGQEAFKAGRRVLARDTVRHLGEPVVMVIAESRSQAVDAAELVSLDIEDLPLVADAAEARDPASPLVWDEVPGNLAFVWTKGDAAKADQAIADAAHVATLNSHVTRVMAHTMEPRGCLAYVSDDGRLTVHPSNQNPFPLRAGLANMLGLAPQDIHVLAGDVGGSFGMKSGMYPEEILVSWAARRLGRPVRWIADRSEGFLSDEHGRDVYVRATLALDAEGRFTALKVSCDINIGAYLSGRSFGLIGNLGGIAGVYRIGAIAAEINAVHTNTQVTAPYRGAGRPEATYLLERVIDIAAQQTGRDPLELRRQNAVPPEAMPYDTGFTFKYDCGEFEQNMIEAAKLADWDGFETRRAEAAARGRLRGLGMANPIEVAGGPFLRPGKDYSRVTVAPDGAVTLIAGVMSVGQGTETAFTNLVAERLGIPPEKVRYVQGDTDLLPGGRGNGGSSSTPVGGGSVTVTLDNLIEAGRNSAAQLLQAAVEDVTFAGGVFSVRARDSSVSLGDVATFAAEHSEDGLAASGEFDPPGVTYPNGCHMCEVEIDPATGNLEIIDYVVVEDIGRVLNPTLARGQMHGGIAQGLGQALFERAIYDAEAGQLVTGSFMDYTMPRADDMPEIKFKTREVPTKMNPLGSKGIGEAGTVGSLAATMNAVCNALQPLGIEHFEMPATPDRLWAAIHQARA
ncbi:MAG TPA: xanthine dehydrogenase family protein molybdopterin-binding subunit [Hyphomicrobiaceae bacterium]|nr:xanthine dehydrogenase family protein molybdopterin-binding subunit [Hyphomicrobiaceae bacterium]